VLPNFFELSNSERSRIENDTILRITEEWLKSDDTTKVRSSAKIIQILSKDKYIKLVKSLMQKRSIFDRLDAFYSKSTDDFQDYLNDFVGRFIDGNINKFRLLLEFSENQIDIKSLSKTNMPKVIEGEKILKEILEEYSKLSDQPNLMDYKNILLSCSKAINCYFTQKETLNSYIIKKSDTNKVIETNNLFKGVSKSVSEFCESLKYDQVDIEMFELSKQIYILTKEILEDIERQKQEINGLDFEDLLIKARDLLRIDKVQRKVSSQLDYLMVDEFQDTNDIQYEIIKLLIPELDTNSSRTSGINLFIVGDGKQSIYGFRNADIRVFMQARKDIQQYNIRLINKGELSRDFLIGGEVVKPTTDSQSSGKLDLRVTFRLNPVPASFVNNVCREIMDPKLSEFEVEYSEFVCAKGAEKVINNTKENIGKISLLLSEGDSNNEMILIAKYIKNIMNDPKYKIIDSDNIERRPKYSDIGILARKKRNFSMLGEALSLHGIPYTIFSGNSFFSSQEILDIISFLKFLHNTNDDAAFAAILRSPFFDIYDDKILQISIEKPNSLWEKYCSWIERENDVDSLENDSVIVEAPLRTYKILQLLLSLAPRLTLSQLIIKILDECSWFATARVSNSFKQKEANMEKFIQFSRDFEERGFRNLYDFVEELEYIQDQEFAEAEATFISGEDALAIMTVHSAKGLEFPIVILFDTNTGVGNQSQYNINDFMGISYGMLVEQEDRKEIRIKSLSHNLSKKWDNLADDAEEKRLLYVAMTRAISHLVISTKVSRSKTGGIIKVTAMIKLIIDGLGITIEDLDSLSEIVMKDNVKLLYNEEIIGKEISYDVEIIKDIQDTDENSEIKQDYIQEELNLIEGITPEPFDSIFSATKLTLFKDDTDSFIDRYILGLPEDMNNSKYARFKESENQDEASGGAEVGSMIHKTLESIKDWIVADGKVDTKILNDTIDRTLTENNRSISDELRLRITQECTYISSTDLLLRYSTFLPDAKIEHFLQMPVKNNILVGSIDMLIQNENGEWEIWDWKSNNVSGKKQMNELAEHYEMQMKVYAGIFSLSNPKQEKIKCRLLFTRRAKNNAKDDDWTYTFEWDASEAKSFIDEIEEDILNINKY